MVVKRNPYKGEIKEEKAQTDAPDQERTTVRDRTAQSREEEPAAGNRETGRGGRAPGADGSRFRARTQRVNIGQRPGQREQSQERTLLHRRQGGAPNAGRESGRSGDPMADPVVGWLVVVAGPGQGQVCRLGGGTNRLGRASSSEISLDFGDEQISRERHAVVTYDHESRTFWVQHGEGRNLTYLGGAPVLTPTPLEAMQDIRIGATTLRFVPFCGPDFDWQDVEAP